uniref:Uncharacterized protein n=1 Tax=Arundo donax TaxID=35708 RepID=A0A0A9FCH7_ARUDO
MQSIRRCTNTGTCSKDSTQLSSLFTHTTVDKENELKKDWLSSEQDQLLQTHYACKKTQNDCLTKRYFCLLRKHASSSNKTGCYFNTSSIPTKYLG